MNKFITVLLGICLSIMGAQIIHQPKFYSRRFYYIDFTGYNIPLGIFMIVVGALFIWTTLKKKEDKEKE